MAIYTFGGPELLRPTEQTIVGTKDDAGIYLALETRLRVVLRVPEGFGTAGGEIGPDAFEAPLRQALAEAMHGMEVNGFVADVVAIARFEDAGR